MQSAGDGVTGPERLSSGSSSSTTVTAAIVVAFAVAFVGLAVWAGSWYSTVEALHVLIAIVWVGGALMIQLFAFRILKETDDDRIAKFAKDAEFISMRTFVPASLILVALGFVLMHQGHWA
jgi:cytochrome bd-type quinol oxidase subunit 1